jgi:hypothetical protein
MMSSVLYVIIELHITCSILHTEVDGELDLR